jgi:hypothetical protein
MPVCKQCNKFSNVLTIDPCDHCGAKDWLAVSPKASTIFSPTTQTNSVIAANPTVSAPRTSSTSKSAVGAGCAWLLIFAAIFVAVKFGDEIWGGLEDMGWIYHDKMTTVYMHNWANGEYKHCTNINANNNDKPYLACDDAKLADEPGKVFNVRFYGKTYQAELPFQTTFDWSCQRKDDDPTIVCKRQDVPK